MGLSAFYKELLIAKEYSFDYFKELESWNFSYLNPLFWIFLILLFLLLLYFWAPKKSFSFCFALGIILLLSTKIDNLISGALFGYPTVKMITIYLLIFVVMYFIFIKRDDL